MERAADDRAEADIGLVERIIGDGRDLIHVDLALRREIGLVYADVHDLADEAAALRVIAHDAAGNGDGQLIDAGRVDEFGLCGMEAGTGELVRHLVAGHQPDIVAGDDLLRRAHADGERAAGQQVLHRAVRYGYRNSKYKENGEEYDIIVRFDEKYRSSITEIENIIIPDGKGQKVRLKELGEIQEFFSPPNIERKSKQRLLKVSITPAAGVALGDIAAVAQEVINNTEIPQEVSVYIGGSYEDQQESFSSLFLLLLLSLMLVYIVMAAQFESFKMPFIIMLAIPFAFTGVVLALLLTNTTLSIVAALGAIMLVGIVTKNGIVLIDFINLMRERGIRLYDAIAMACRSRLRPVLMTSLTTILGMVPMAISAGEGSETWRPMGVAVIGGMVFSTIITMLIVPAVYAAMDKSGSRDKKKILSKQFKFMADFNAERDLPKKK